MFSSSFVAVTATAIRRGERTPPRFGAGAGQCFVLALFTICPLNIYSLLHCEKPVDHWQCLPQRRPQHRTSRLNKLTTMHDDLALKNGCRSAAAPAKQAKKSPAAGKEEDELEDVEEEEGQVGHL